MCQGDVSLSLMLLLLLLSEETTINDWPSHRRSTFPLLFIRIIENGQDTKARAVQENHREEGGGGGKEGRRE